MIVRPDAIIEVRFKTAGEGGRETSVAGDVYSCPILIDGRGFDCRIFLGNMVVDLGEYYQLPVRFLNRDLAISMLFPGKPITLWEGKDVADGKVLDILPSS